MLTSGYELSTAITNLLLFIISIIIIFNIKNKSFKWFYFFICIDSFLGVIVHGFNMSNILNTILWYILYFLFSITFNLLLHLFCNIKLKNVMIISFIIAIIMVIIFSISIKFNINRLDNIVMLLYALSVVLFSLYNIIKSDYINKYYFIIGIIIQIIGIIPIFIKYNIWCFNYNGICHLFTLITIILIYIGVIKNKDML